MSFGGSTRTSIEFDISAPGAGLPEDIARAIGTLQSSLSGVQSMYEDGAITVQQYIGQTRGLEKQIKALQGVLDQVNTQIAANQAAMANSGQGAGAWAAAIQSATQAGGAYGEQLRDLAALQAHLGQMEERSAREAAEAQALLGNATKTASAQVHDQAGEIERAANAKRQAAKDAAMLAREERGLAEALDRLAEEEELLPAAIDTTTAAHGRATTAARKAGDAAASVGSRGRQGLIQLGYSIDDIQYGMRGVGNNLIQFAAQMGGTFAGVATVAIASATVLYNQWDNIAAGLSESIRTTGDDIESLKKRIKELEDKPAKFALDLTELDRAKQKLDDLESKRAAFEAASKAMTDTQGKVASNVREAVVEHAGGTDLQSGAANLAKAIADKQKQQGKFYTGEDKTNILNAENEAKRTKAAVDLMDPTADPMVQNELIRQQSAAQQKLEDLSRDAESKGMKRIQDELIGGALKGIDADRQRLLDTIAADPKFFARRGIGDQFRADLITGSAANVRGQAQQAVDQARAKRNAASDKVVADAEKAKLNFEAENLNEQGRANEQAGEQAQQDQKKAQTEHDRAVADAARKNIVATEGRNQDLTQGVNTTLGMGLDPDEIVKRLAPQAGQRLAKVPGMDPGLIAEVAEKIVRDVIAKQAPQVVAAGGGAAGAARLNADLAGKNFDAANRGIATDRRRDNQAAEPQIAARFEQLGANVGQAQTMAHATLAYMNKGLDLDRAMMAAWLDMQRQILGLQQGQAQLWQQFQRASGAGRTFASNLPRGRRR